MPEKKVIDWFLDANTCFLFGAGCSCCADKPLMPNLTDKIIKKLSQDSQNLFKELENKNGRNPTIEDLINQLLQIKKILEPRKIQTFGSWDLTKLDAGIKQILKEIVNEIGAEWKSCNVHENFLKRLSTQASKKYHDIFCLNYDVVLESSLESLRFYYIDGFCGSENAFFDPKTYDIEPNSTPFYKIYKLHGSINWVRDNDGTVRRKPVKVSEEKFVV